MLSNNVCKIFTGIHHFQVIFGPQSEFVLLTAYILTTDHRPSFIYHMLWRVGNRKIRLVWFSKSNTYDVRLMPQLKSVFISSQPLAALQLQVKGSSVRKCCRRIVRVPTLQIKHITKPIVFNFPSGKILNRKHNLISGISPFILTIYSSMPTLFKRFAHILQLARFTQSLS